MHSFAKPFTEQDILTELDLAEQHIPGAHFPVGLPDDIRYNFPLDLEDAYCVVAGAKIHLYADAKRWAIVMEESGYHTRQSAAIINIIYVGNCIDYPIEKAIGHTYISNMSIIHLVSDFEQIRNMSGSAAEQFEKIRPSSDAIIIRGKNIKIEHDPTKYQSVGIDIDTDENPRKLIGYGDFIRYLNETDPAIISAQENDLRKYIPPDLPMLMTIDKFHYTSLYSHEAQLSQQETFRMIAKVLVLRDTSKWKPTLKPNNHWSNWTSGNL